MIVARILHICCVALACAVLLHPAARLSAQDRKDLYKPTDETAGRMTVMEAKRIIEKEASGCDCFFTRGIHRVDRIAFRQDGIELALTKPRSETVTIPFEDLHRIEVEHSTIRIGGGRSFVPGERARHQPGLARRVADAFYVLRRSNELGITESESITAHIEQLRIDEARFEQSLARYSTEQKPEFPEDARRFRVQAETAVREKRFDDAARSYREALQAASWWPEGRFNRSLLLGELKRYDEAIREMKRYLALAPDAPNARAAQDKIYEWEGRARQKP
jgi:tetratricopeptide (TPR) repeat protein